MSSRTYVVETIFRAIDKMSTTLGVINRAIGKHTRSLRAAADAVSVWSRKSSRALSSAAQWASLRISAPLTLAGGAALKASGDIEQMGIAFQTMLRDADRGNAVLDNLIQFANVTPFQTEEVVRAGKIMLAMGVTAEDLGGHLKMMGDIAAGTGQPLAELASIFGKTRAKGMMMTEELYQFAERGLPIIEILQKGLGLSGEELLEAASKRQITFDVALKALQNMTDEGGVFSAMMEKQSRTLLGLWSTLTSKIWLSSAAVGDVMVETLGLREVLEKMAGWVDAAGEGFRKWADINPELAKMATSAAVFVAAGAPLLFILAGIAFAFSVLATPAGAATLAMIALAAAAVGSVVGVNSAINNLNNSIGIIFGALAILFVLISPLAGLLFAATSAAISFGVALDHAFAVAAIGAGVLLFSLSPILATIMATVGAVYLLYEAWKTIKGIHDNWDNIRIADVFGIDEPETQKISEVGTPGQREASDLLVNKDLRRKKDSFGANNLSNPILPFAPVAVPQGGDDFLPFNILPSLVFPPPQPAKDGRVQVDINLTGDKSDSASVAVQSSGEVLTGAAKLHRAAGVGEN